MRDCFKNSVCTHTVWEGRPNITLNLSPLCLGSQIIHGRRHLLLPSASACYCLLRHLLCLHAPAAVLLVTMLCIAHAVLLLTLLCVAHARRQAAELRPALLCSTGAAARQDWWLGAGCLRLQQHAGKEQVQQVYTLLLLTGARTCCFCCCSAFTVCSSRLTWLRAGPQAESPKPRYPSAVRLLTQLDAGLCTAVTQSLRDLQMPCFAVLLLLLLPWGFLFVSSAADDFSSISEEIMFVPLQEHASSLAVTMSLRVKYCSKRARVCWSFVEQICRRATLVCAAKCVDSTLTSWCVYLRCTCNTMRDLGPRACTS
jgi:hypothetical protein